MLDPATLAFWERSHRGAKTNVGPNGRVVVYIYGTARIMEQGPERDAVMDKVAQKELDADRERTGAAVIIWLDRVTDLRDVA